MPHPAPNDSDAAIALVVRAAADGLDSPDARDLLTRDLEQLARTPHAVEWAEACFSLLERTARGVVLAAPQSALLAALPLARARLEDVQRRADAAGEWAYHDVWRDVDLSVQALVGVARRYQHRAYARDLDQALGRITRIEALALQLHTRALELDGLTPALAPPPATPPNPYAPRRASRR